MHRSPFGGNVFGWTADEASFALLDAWLDAGFNFIDTADVYSRVAPGNSGESETIIGNWLKARGGRDQVIIATKLGIEMGPGRKGLSRAYMLQAVEGFAAPAADRLHRPLPVAPRRSRHADRGDLRGVRDLIKQGKVREIGASNSQPTRLAEALRISAAKGLPRYQSLQPHYNLVERGEFEGPLEDLCLKEKIGVIGYYSWPAAS